MKKWIVGLALVVTLMLVLGFGAQKLIEWRLFPQQSFTLSQVPPAPDYRENEYWAAKPTFADTSDLIPPNVTVDNDIKDKKVDVFFVHSTGYVGARGWNSDMAIDNSETQSLQYMLSSMASAFNGCCDIYAPNYRQAHIAAFVNEDTDSSFKALDLAYSDVEAAFEYYLQHYNQGRPFMLVAHSQGSLHSLRLLMNKVENSALKDKLVATYTIGYWLPMDMFERSFQNLVLCQSATQIGCIVSFDAYGEGGGMQASERGVRHWYASSGWEEVKNQAIACVNPLSWQADTKWVDASKHLGAFPVEFKREFIHMLTNENPGFVFQELPELTSKLTWAQCGQNGELFVAEQKDNLFSNHLDNADKSYHVLDYSLFYGNIRENAIARVNAYFARE